MTDYLHEFLYGIYPYICLAVLLLGSLITSIVSSTRGRAIPHRCCAEARYAWAAICFTGAFW